MARTPINRNDAVAALSLHDGDVKAAAKALGTTQREIKRFGIKTA